MSEDLTIELLQMAVAHTLRPLGWQAMSASAGDVLADVMGSYILAVAKGIVGYSCHANRTDPNLSDVARAFSDLGITCPDLSEFCAEVDMGKFKHTIPKYPRHKPSTHTIQPTHAELTERRCFRSSNLISDEECGLVLYLPPLPTVKDQKGQDAEHGAYDYSVKEEAMNTGGESSKGAIVDPNKGLPQHFRSERLSSDFSEEGDFRTSTSNVGGSPSTLVCVDGTSRTETACSPAVGAKGQLIEVAVGVIGVDLQGQKAKVDSAVSGSSFQKRETRVQSDSVTSLTSQDPQRVNSFDGALQPQANPTGESITSEQACFSIARKPKLPPLRLISIPSTTEHITHIATYRMQQPPLSPLQRSPGPIQPGRPFGLPILSPIQRLPYTSTVAGSAEFSRQVRPLQPMLTSPPILSPTPVGQLTTTDEVRHVSTEGAPSHITASTIPPVLYNIVSHSESVSPLPSVVTPEALLHVCKPTEPEKAKPQVGEHLDVCVSLSKEVADHQLQVQHPPVVKDQSLLVPATPSLSPQLEESGREDTYMESSPAVSAISTSSSEGEGEVGRQFPPQVISLESSTSSERELSTPADKADDSQEVKAHQKVHMAELERKGLRTEGASADTQGGVLQEEATVQPYPDKSSKRRVATREKFPVHPLSPSRVTVVSSGLYEEVEESDDDSSLSGCEAQIIQAETGTTHETVYDDLPDETMKMEEDQPPSLIVKLRRNLVQSLQPQMVGAGAGKNERFQVTSMFNLAGSTISESTLPKSNLVTSSALPPSTLSPESPPHGSFTVSLGREFLGFTRFSLNPNPTLTSSYTSTLPSKDRAKVAMGSSDADCVKRRLARNPSSVSKARLLTKPTDQAPPVSATTSQLDALDMEESSTKKAKVDSTLQDVNISLYSSSSSSSTEDSGSLSSSSSPSPPPQCAASLSPVESEEEKGDVGKGSRLTLKLTISKAVLKSTAAAEATTVRDERKLRRRNYPSQLQRRGAKHHIEKGMKMEAFRPVGVGIGGPSPRYGTHPKLSSSKTTSLSVSIKTPLAHSSANYQVYICPECTREDDGTPMIACDRCDTWLHMHCVGMSEPPPECTKWFCPACMKRETIKSKTRRR